MLGAFGIETKVTDAPRDVAPSFADSEEIAAKPAARVSATMLVVVVIVLLVLAAISAWKILQL